MLIVFFLSVVFIVGISPYENEGEAPKAIDFSEIPRAKDPVYNVTAFGILGITAALYVLFW